MISVEQARVDHKNAVAEWLRQIEMQADSELGRYGTFAIHNTVFDKVGPLVARYEAEGFTITRGLKNKEGEGYLTISLPKEEVPEESDFDFNAGC